MLEGPHGGRMGATVRDALVGTTWTVSARSDRVGLRLDGEPIALHGQTPLASLPMVPGAVQLPPGGLPIVLMPDAPSVGGYPVPAVGARVDQPRLGQLRAGDEVRFVWIEMEQAARWRHDADHRFRRVIDSWA